MKEAQAAEVVVKLFLQMAQVSELLDVVKKGKAMTGVYIYIYIRDCFCTLRSMLARALSVLKFRKLVTEYLALDLNQRHEVLGRSNRRLQQNALAQPFTIN